jgi:hypothetical protein
MHQPTPLAQSLKYFLRLAAIGTAYSSLRMNGSELYSGVMSTSARRELIFRSSTERRMTTPTKDSFVSDVEKPRMTANGSTPGLRKSVFPILFASIGVHPRPNPL